MTIRLITGAEIVVVGLDRPQRIEGRAWNGGVVDEVANIRPGAWGENIRPALADRNDWAWLIGVPEGRGAYYDMFTYACSGEDAEWDGFHWISADILSPSEIESARRTLDPLVYQQEMEASFVTFEGRAYYAFDRNLHCPTIRLRHNPVAPLIICLDFNVEPGVAAICQEQQLPTRNEAGQWVYDDRPPRMARSPRPEPPVIGEVHIPRNSTTPAVCRKIAADWGQNTPVLSISTATRPAALADQRASWAAIGTWSAPSASCLPGPSLDPGACGEPGRASACQRHEQPHDVGGRRYPHDGRSRQGSEHGSDLEGVRLLAGGSGELDKKADPKLSHISDALGYYIQKQFPTTKQHASVQDLLIG